MYANKARQTIPSLKLAIKTKKLFHDFFFTESGIFDFSGSISNVL